LEEGILAAGAVGLMAIAFLWSWRFVVETRLKQAVGSATERMRGVSSHKNQVQGHYEQRRAQLTTKQTELASLRKQVTSLRAAVKQASASDFIVLHQIGEPAKDKQEFSCSLVLTQPGEGKQDLPSALKAAEHLAIVWSEEEATARRLLDLQFPAAGALRVTGFHRKAG